MYTNEHEGAGPRWHEVEEGLAIELAKIRQSDTGTGASIAAFDIVDKMVEVRKIVLQERREARGEALDVNMETAEAAPPKTFAKPRAVSVVAREEGLDDDIEAPPAKVASRPAVRRATARG
jgi:hypothetical protein